MDPLTIALNALRSTIQALPQGLAGAFRGSQSPIASQSSTPGIGKPSAFNAILENFAKPLQNVTPILAGFTHKIQAFGSRIDIFNRISRALVPPNAAAVAGSPGAVKSSWGQVLQAVTSPAKRLFAAPTTNVQGYATQLVAAIASQARRNPPRPPIGTPQPRPQAGTPSSNIFSAFASHLPKTPTAAAAATGWARVGSMIASGMKFGGMAIGGIGFAASALQGIAALPFRLRQFAESINQANRSLAPFNTRLGIAYIKQDINEFARLRHMGTLTSETAVSLANSVDRMRNSWFGVDTFGRNVQNRLGIAASEGTSVVGDYASSVSRSIDRLIGRLDPSGDRLGAAISTAMENGLRAVFPFLGARPAAPPIPAFADNGRVALQNMGWMWGVNRPRAAPPP